MNYQATLIQWMRNLTPRSWRNALRRPGVTVQRMIAKLKAQTGARETLELIPGWMLLCHPMCKEEFLAFKDDSEQKQEILSFIQHCKPNMRFIDVGAHWGVFTLAALKYGGESASVLVIEASDAAVAILKDNLNFNGSLSRVSVVNAACGDFSGELRMLTTGAGGADYFIVPREERPDSTMVMQVTLDDTVEKYGFHPTHLKIDVEGYEREVLTGAQSVLLKCAPLLFLELHGDMIRDRGDDPEDVLTLLEKSGYTTWINVDGSLLTPDLIRARRHNLRMIASTKPFDREEKP